MDWSFIFPNRLNGENDFNFFRNEVSKALEDIALVDFMRIRFQHDNAPRNNKTYGSFKHEVFLN